MTLPNEILNLICQQLGRDRDFATLYQCALSTKSLADSALRVLYQNQENSPSFIQSDELDRPRGETTTFATVIATQDLMFRRWACLWRSIILSSFDCKTYQPYCCYLRVLDFRNLERLLEDYKFQGPIRKKFFAGELGKFLYETKLNNSNSKNSKRTVVNVIPSINSVGDAISPYANLVEEISGNLSPDCLPRWIARSPKLRSLVLWQGDAIGNGAGESIRDHCEYFKSLTIRGWLQPDADQRFANFLTSIKGNTLEYMQMISLSSIERLSFEALGAHRHSLKELRLGGLSQKALESLNCLKDCTALSTIFLEAGFGASQLENEVFVEVVGWLSSCPQLRDLTLQQFHADGPAILAQVLSAPRVKLDRLSLEGYVVQGETSAAFHTALAEQQSLKSLLLKGSGEDASVDDLDIMVGSLCNLTNLRELELKDVSDAFEEHHISNLCLCLPNLEDFWTSGREIGGDVLTALLNLTCVKNLTLYAITQFTCTEIIDFIGSLDQNTQKPFNLSLMAVDSEYDLSLEEQDLIKDILRSDLDGRFDFVLWRDADSSDSDDD